VSKWNGKCDHPECERPATHHGPQYSQCDNHPPTKRHYADILVYVDAEQHRHDLGVRFISDQREFCAHCGRPFELDPQDVDGIVPHEHG
jgi:hypothetical protein